MSPLMKEYLKGLGVSLLGLLLGGLLNMGIVKIGGVIIAPPINMDTTSLEDIKANMHLFEPKHFIMPFLAHALGTLFGAFIATRLGNRKALIPALIIGAFFFYGGYQMVQLVPSPTWFTAVDLGLAYIPMAILGWWLGKK